MLGQRLVRVLCQHCKKAVSASPEQVTIMRQTLAHYPEPVTIADGVTIYESVGCEACGGTGFKGRVGVFEAIIIDDKVEEIVIRDPREVMILDAAASQNIPSMAEDGMIKVLAGVTTIDELERVVDLQNVRRAKDQPAASDEEIDISKYIV
jgi:type II secretory ATPase GspE/PulE/Tfp pilus assembly ATPase PilB-like protein